MKDFNHAIPPSFPWLFRRSGRASALGGGVGAGSAFAQTPLTVGFIYVGPKDDFGYNQAHAEGAAAVKAMPGVTVLEEENVPRIGRCAEHHGIDDQL